MARTYRNKYRNLTAKNNYHRNAGPHSSRKVRQADRTEVLKELDNYERELYEDNKELDEFLCDVDGYEYELLYEEYYE